jgi:hypothetical protein
METIVIEIPFKKGEPAPSFEQFGIFYKEFGKLLPPEVRENSEIYFEYASIKIFLTIFRVSLITVSANDLINYLTNAPTAEHKQIVTNMYNSGNNNLNNNKFEFTLIKINNIKIPLKSYQSEFSQDEKTTTVSLIQYKIVATCTNIEEERDESETLIQQKIKKVIATAELLENKDGFKKGDKIQFKTEKGFCKRQTIYIASFTIQGRENAELTNDPQIVGKLPTTPHLQIP